MIRLRVTPSIIPNLFTSLNIFCGFLSVIQSSKGNFENAAWLIVASAIFDALDGFMARLTKSSSELGVELDSLSDVISFGLAPSFLLYSIYFHQLNSIGILISALPVITGAFRLARFNVQLVGFDKKFFTGLPIPMCALTFITFYLSFFESDKEFFEKILPGMVIILSFLMISKVKYDTLPKIKISEIKSNPLKYVLILFFIVMVIVLKIKGLFFAFVLVILFGIFRHIFNKIQSKFLLKNV
ncbi:MAG: CDP-diacylglycerol--serine O-phosphatidyltransferase [Ignavibacterium sp.]|nr:CDP-diacylglycerol--serine O-phosphatidyltransferase [Ignavibacterium sp.]